MYLTLESSEKLPFG